MSKDLRFIRTEKYIKNAFLQLLKTRPYEKITINDIVQLAEISRNAFYLHYYSKEALFDSLIDSVVTNFINRQNQILEKYEVINIDTAKECMSAIIEALYEEEEISRILFTVKGGGVFSQRLIDKLANYLYSTSIRSTLTEKELLDLKCCCDYIASGIIGIIRFGFQHETQYSKDELEILLYSINSGAASLLTSFSQY